VHHGKVRMAVGQERLCARGCSVVVTDEKDFLSAPLRWAQVAWKSYQVS
jgi:hypothetical protein